MKDDLIERVISAQEFRARKVEEFPDDQRNRTSIEALEGLTDYLRKLPADHRVFRAYGKAMDSEHGAFIIEDALETGENTDLIARYGFDSAVNHAEFVHDLTYRLEKELKGRSD